MISNLILWRSWSIKISSCSWCLIVNKRVLILDDLRCELCSPATLHEQSCKHAAPSDSLHARHVWTRVQDYPGHVWTRGGQVLLYHIYTLRPLPQMSGSGGATCIKNRMWEQTLEIIKNNIQQKQSIMFTQIYISIITINAYYVYLFDHIIILFLGRTVLRSYGVGSV